MRKNCKKYAKNNKLGKNTKGKNMNNFSKNCIVDSLIILMDKQKLEDITMEDISAKSGVSRRTIYRYFNNKHEILSKYIDGLVQDYTDYIKNNMNKGKNIVELSFEFAQLRYNFFCVAYKNNMLINVVELLESMIKSVLLQPKNSYFATLPSEEFANYTSFVAGGIWGILRKWINSGGIQSPKQLYESYKKIVNNLHVRLT